MHENTIYLLGAIFALFVLIQILLLVRRKTVLQKKRVAWFTRPKNRPAVYVLQSRSNPDFFKVGYTSRKVETRIREIEAVHGPVSLIYSFRMPHAYAAEQRAHSRLSRAFGVKPLGREWYQVRRGKSYVKKAVLKSALSVKREAALKLSWPKKAKIFIWKEIE